MSKRRTDADVSMGPTAVIGARSHDETEAEGDHRLQERSYDTVRRSLVRPDPRDELVEHLPSLRAFAVSLTRDGVAADDLVQDTVVTAWKTFARFKPGTNLRAWLFTILRNTFYVNCRKARREVADVDRAVTATLPEKPRRDGVLAFGDFLEAFRMLPVEQREALVLVGASGFSYEEAAETCGVAVGTVRNRVNRARARLVQRLGLRP